MKLPGCENQMFLKPSCIPKTSRIFFRLQKSTNRPNRVEFPDREKSLKINCVKLPLMGILSQTADITNIMFLLCLQILYSSAHNILHNKRTVILGHNVK